jgi:hypothetical protein
LTCKAYVYPGLVPLFLGIHGKRLAPALMALTFCRYATAAGVNKRKHITPHSPRTCSPRSCSVRARTSDRFKSF